MILFLFWSTLFYCFICPISNLTVSEDAGIEPRTVVTLAMVVQFSNHSAKSHSLKLYSTFSAIKCPAGFVATINNTSYPVKFRYSFIASGVLYFHRLFLSRRSWTWWTFGVQFHQMCPNDGIHWTIKILSAPNLFPFFILSAQDTGGGALQISDSLLTPLWTKQPQQEFLLVACRW